jgi:hypothetical protein
MADLKDMDLDDLEKLVEREQTMYKFTVEFAEQVVIDFGRDLNFSVSDCYTTRVAQVDDFHGFTFYMHSGQSMFGGTDVKISYQGQEVVSIYYQSSIKEMEIKKYESGEWESELRQLLINQEYYYKKYKEAHPELEVDLEKDKEERSRKWDSAERFFTEYARAQARNKPTQEQIAELEKQRKKEKLLKRAKDLGLTEE